MVPQIEEKLEKDVVQTKYKPLYLIILYDSTIAMGAMHTLSPRFAFLIIQYVCCYCYYAIAIVILL